MNRKLARKLLYDKLDLAVNGDTSKMGMRDMRVKRTKDRQKRRRNSKELSIAVSEKEEEEDLSRYDEIKLDKIGKDIK